MLVASVEIAWFKLVATNKYNQQIGGESTGGGGGTDAGSNYEKRKAARISRQAAKV